MGKAYNDFSSLKGLRKELEKQDMNKPETAPEPAARPKAEIPPAPEKVQVEKERIEPGMKVRPVDLSGKGVITEIGKGFFMVEVDGFPMRLARSEFILVDEADDKRLSAASRHVARKMPRTKVPSAGGDLVVDLHCEKIPGSERVPEWGMLEFQLNYFRQILRENLRHRGRRIVFIHGDGDGTLRKAIRNELDSTFAASCTYGPAPSEFYGTGATVVTIR